MPESSDKWMKLFRMGWSFLGDMGIAALFLITWIAPYAYEPFMVHKLTFLMLVQFLVVHSTGFFFAIGARANTLAFRLGSIGGLLVLHSLFAWGFSAAYGGPWPFYAFMLVTLPRLPAIVFQPLSDHDQFLAMGAWAGMVVLYLSGTFLTVLIDIPPLGVTEAVIAHQDYGIGGLWPEQPYRVLAFGAYYFAAQACLFLLIDGIADRHTHTPSGGVSAD